MGCRETISMQLGEQMQHQMLVFALQDIGNHQDPTGIIDPQVLEEHFLELDMMRGNSEGRDPLAPENVTDEPVSQVVQIHVESLPIPSNILPYPITIENTSIVAISQNLPTPSTTVGTSLKRQKIIARRGNRLNLSKSQARKQLPIRPPVFRQQELEKDAEDRSKLGGNEKKKRKAWLPPGLGGCSGSACAHGRLP
ncbi:uncharacterized protein LOC120282579 isoform X2 [Dioscorea cayenensis subsp. rotundata]|uniref:Uncharacterized protein LOC120282579 isoform X2 n=1 Tax=Dioscorea cayennensis subsp. rotundata TaxID=55577 RepID=A0AB40D532_DIOCR|nr:uncharacterized protein LOC120282579 isoform X2 [Dioscorea cayenensis subsp. rotundata]